MNARLKRAAYLAAGGLTAGVLGLAVAVDRFGQKDRASPAEVIVVLGARVLEGGVASGALAARVEHGVALYRRGLAPRLLFSGGVGRHPPSEAEAALAIATALGVPASDCLLETDSHSTYENARNSARLLRERGLSRVIVVSDPYHLLRARQYFRREGFEVLTSPALLSDRNVSLPDRVYWTVREAFALLARPSVLLAGRPR